MSLTCQADFTWSGLPEEPRVCEQICDVSVLDLDLQNDKQIAPEHREYLQDPNDEPHYDCTNGDILDSECSIVCPSGFKQWPKSKYPRAKTECTKNGWNPDPADLNTCVPDCWPDCDEVTTAAPETPDCWPDCQQGEFLFCKVLMYKTFEC